MKFQVLSLPRCGTTWAANWLTDNDAICYHDPLSYKTTKELSKHEPGFDWGISCTASWLAPKWINSFYCQRIILVRDLSEINESLVNLGLPEMSPYLVDMFNQLDGWKVNYKDLFNPEKAEEIWAYLRGTPFNRERHKILCEMQIQPDFTKWQPDLAIITKLLQEGE